MVFAADRGTIDRELASHIDFRAYDYASCLAKSECTVAALTLTAERFEEKSSEWLPARFYWDPVDGLGVQDGAQNDEIDFDERIRVTFSEPVNIRAVWLSDLFHTEDRRYGSSDTSQVIDAPEDAELAGITLTRDGIDLETVLVAAGDRLPWASFNQEVSPRFLEQGDMRRRVVINEDRITLVVPGKDRIQFLKKILELDQIDDKKQKLFEGLETVDIDLTTILAEFQDAPLFAVGTSNFELVKGMASSAEVADRIRAQAEKKRVSINMSNGEIRWTSDAPVLVDSVTFLAPFDASNDFSVAGIVLEKNGD